MDDFWASIPVADISFPTILGLVIIAIIRGDLVPRKVLASERADKEYWRGQALGLLDTNSTLAEAAKVTAKVVGAHPQPLPQVGEVTES